MAAILEKEILSLQQRKIDAIRLCKEAYSVDILGKKLIVLPTVFYPASDTKLLIQSVTISSKERVLEPFSGTGAVSIFLARHAREVVATDINPAAVENIRENIRLHGLEEKMQVIEADIFPDVGKFDVIVINPPYTDKEAHDFAEKALWDENHSSVRRFFSEAKNYLVPQGRIYSTWASFADFNLIEKMARNNNYHIQCINELSRKNKVYRVYELKLKE